MAQKGWKITITPKFNSKKLYHETLGTDWAEFQLEANIAGLSTANYMINYINNNCKRAGSTKKLEGAIRWEQISTTAGISWGVGNLATLNAIAKYWYVVNYGKKITGEDFVPGGSQYRPVEFVDGKANPTKAGQGHSQVTKWKRIENPSTEPRPNIMRPMGYIEATQRELVKYLRGLLKKFGKYKGMSK
jgi:hypothetical protein